MGSGCFGRVVKAEVDGFMIEGEPVKTVAVKMVRTTSGNFNEAATSLANELIILCHLGSHKNVVNLLGAYTKNIHSLETVVTLILY